MKWAEGMTVPWTRWHRTGLGCRFALDIELRRIMQW